MTKHVVIPAGCWPARMPPELAAGYVGERSTEAFLKLVGKDYPAPVVDEGSGKGRRRIWLKRDLDRVLGLDDGNSDPPELE